MLKLTLFLKLLSFFFLLFTPLKFLHVSAYPLHKFKKAVMTIAIKILQKRTFVKKYINVVANTSFKTLRCILCSIMGMHRDETLTSGGKSGILTGFDLIKRQHDNTLQEELLKREREIRKLMQISYTEM